MAAASGERAPAFTAQELEKLVDGVLPQYTLLYGPPDQQVSAHQKKDIWRAIDKDVRTLGVHQRRGTHCRKRWEDISPLEQEDGGGSAGDGLRTWEECPSHHDPPDVPDPGSGLPGVGWALEGITADTRGSRSSTSAKKSQVPVVRVKGVWSAPATRAASVTWSQSTASPPPVKHLKLESGRRERGKTPAGKTAHKGPGGSAESAVNPPKVVKGQKKSPKSGKSSKAEKAAILPAGRDTTASTVVTGPETTARVSALEGSSIVTGQETTARVSALEGSSIVTGLESTARVSALEGSTIVTGQETTARVSALEGSSIVTGPETTARISALEGSSIVTGPETTARVSALEGSSIVTGPETTASVSDLEGPGSHSPAGH
ncbi:hypothetical protein NDU88_003197 [Pleurodeles waltl]|uniref:Myb/SANT-like DNA-binding domain-containing protein n=1 Tax=Pleurodeles waltl TaxID=8319 RepID=A0AAV7T4A5_PLEWA|nr:hypothetical protein NDU88_003197 [Pleurodeles waltl]